MDGTLIVTTLVQVLILVLMEDTLREETDGYFIKRIPVVLILVLMEDTLREHAKEALGIDVLILVLMEDTLRG